MKAHLAPSANRKHWGENPSFMSAFSLQSDCSSLNIHEWHIKTQLSISLISSARLYLRVKWTQLFHFLPSPLQWHLGNGGELSWIISLAHLRFMSTTSSQMSLLTETGEFSFHSHPCSQPLQQCDTCTLEPSHSYRQLSEHPDAVQAAGGSCNPDGVPPFPLLAVMCACSPPQHPSSPDRRRCFSWPLANSSRSGSLEQQNSENEAEQNAI